MQILSSISLELQFPWWILIQFWVHHRSNQWNFRSNSDAVWIQCWGIRLLLVLQTELQSRSLSPLTTFQNAEMSSPHSVIHTLHAQRAVCSCMISISACSTIYTKQQDVCSLSVRPIRELLLVSLIPETKIPLLVNVCVSSIYCGKLKKRIKAHEFAILTWPV